MQKNTPVQIKLLNVDGSFNRFIYTSEFQDLRRADRLVTVRARKGIGCTLARLKPLPPPSNSKETPGMPTLGDVLSYVGLRKCTDEQRAKIEACRPHMVASSRICSLSGDSYRTLEQELEKQEAEVHKIGGGYQSPEIAA